MKRFANFFVFLIGIGLLADASLAMHGEGTIQSPEVKPRKKRKPEPLAEPIVDEDELINEMKGLAVDFDESEEPYASLNNFMAAQDVENFRAQYEQLRSQRADDPYVRKCQKMLLEKMDPFLLQSGVKLSIRQGTKLFTEHPKQRLEKEVFEAHKRELMNALAVLAQHQALPKFLNNANKRPIVAQAAENGWAELIPVLAAHYDINAVDRCGYDALLLAAKNSRPKETETLLNLGVDPTTRRRLVQYEERRQQKPKIIELGNLTALDVAIKNRKIPCADMLFAWEVQNGRMNQARIDELRAAHQEEKKQQIITDLIDKYLSGNQ